MSTKTGSAAKTLVLVCCRVDSAQDARFLYDAIRFIQALEVRLVPSSNIHLFVTNTCLSQKNTIKGILEDLEEHGLGFGLSSKEFLRVLNDYVKKEEFKDLLKGLKGIDKTQYERITVLLLNHGNTIGTFGNSYLDREELAGYFLDIAIPTVIISSSCFATQLFRTFAQFPHHFQNVVRIYDAAAFATFSWSWGLMLAEDIVPCGTKIMYWVLDALYRANSLQNDYVNITALNGVPKPDAMSKRVCCLRIEGKPDLILNQPFFGIPPHTHKLRQPELDTLKDVEEGGKNSIIILDMSTSIMHTLPRKNFTPAYVELLEQLKLPPTFWDECFSTEVEQKAYALPDNQLVHVVELVKKLESKKLIDHKNNGALSPYVLYFNDLIPQFLPIVEEYKIST